eukprot:366564-Chlamydomonas_euryale.AAC.13
MRCQGLGLRGHRNAARRPDAPLSAFDCRYADAGLALRVNAEQSIKKMNRVIKLIRGLPYEEAVYQCRLQPRKAARILLEVGGRRWARCAAHAGAGWETRGAACRACWSWVGDEGRGVPRMLEPDGRRWARRDAHAGDWACCLASCKCLAWHRPPVL